MPDITIIRVFNGSSIEPIRIPDEITALARSLPEDHPSYFNITPDQSQAPVDRLVLSHYRPEGVANAVRYMAAARNGEIDRRAPINVCPTTDGDWQVLDGNSTATIALAAGWSTLPVTIVAADDDA